MREKTLKDKRQELKENKKIIKEIFDFFDRHLDWGGIPMEENPIDCVFIQKDYIKFKKRIQQKVGDL